jgi:hypothetical protein
MRSDVECCCLIALGLAFACRQSGPPSNDVSSEASAGAADRPGVAVATTAERGAVAPWPVTYRFKRAGAPSTRSNIAMLESNADNLRAFGFLGCPRGARRIKSSATPTKCMYFPWGQTSGQARQTTSAGRTEIADGLSDLEVSRGIVVGNFATVRALTTGEIKTLCPTLDRPYSVDTSLLDSVPPPIPTDPESSRIFAPAPGLEPGTVG